MASLIFSHSKSIVNKAKKEASKMATAMMQLDVDYQTTYNQQYEMEINRAFREFDDYLDVSKQLHERYLEFSQGGDKEYFITLRPDDKRVSFDDFQQKVIEYLNRKCFVSYDCSFEQKGMTDDTLGQGFHCHIVAKMKQLSKANVLRDTLSSFQKCDWIAPNCIQILPTKNGRELVQNYLIDYKSTDGHKEVTREFDDKWRDNLGICMLVKK